MWGGRSLLQTGRLFFFLLLPCHVSWPCFARSACSRLPTTTHDRDHDQDDGHPDSSLAFFVLFFFGSGSHCFRSCQRVTPQVLCAASPRLRLAVVDRSTPLRPYLGCALPVSSSSIKSRFSGLKSQVSSLEPAQPLPGSTLEGPPSAPFSGGRCPTVDPLVPTI